MNVAKLLVHFRLQHYKRQRACDSTFNIEVTYLLELGSPVDTCLSLDFSRVGH